MVSTAHQVYKNFAPIMHPTLHDHHRVPVLFIDGKYEVFVGDHHVRIYEEKDLPPVIRSKLSMVKASITSAPNEDPYLIAKAYECPPDSPMYEIGWQPCEALFVLVIPTKDLTYLKGEEYAPAYRHTEGIGFIANTFPTNANIDEHVRWLRLRKEKSKTK